MGHVGSEVSFESSTAALLPTSSYTTSTPKNRGEAFLSSSSASSDVFFTPNASLAPNNIPSCSNDLDGSRGTSTNPHCPVQSPSSWALSPVMQQQQEEQQQHERDLSNNDEIISKLHIAPILEYLLRNHAILPQEFKELEKNDDAHDVTFNDVDDRRLRNVRLLEIVEKHPQSRTLFMNALRHTGQHEIANMADDGARIKALSGSGYLSKKRRKGEIEFHVRVKSVDSIDDETFRIVSDLLQKEISLEEICIKFSSLRRQQQQQRNSALLESNGIENKKKSVNKKEKKCCRCLCCCCVCCCSRRKKNLNSEEAEVPMTSLSNITGLDSVVVTQQPVSMNSLSTQTVYDVFKGNMEDLKKVYDQIDNICKDIYNCFADAKSSLHKMLARYIEQDLGVLLLETTSINKLLQLKFICTKIEQVDSVANKFHSGKLAADLKNLVHKWAEEENKGTKKGMTFDLEVVGLTFEEIRKELSG